ncbi:hypothetical protein MRB53_040642 [Persea americana]|nr:hypothetical protein MRB53_040642 [Persea americana]
MDEVVAGLNDAQRAAVTSDADVLQVLAPPGSGKTKTLTARVAALLARGIKPWSIIVCTFTIKAAMEMSERIEAFVGKEAREKLRIGTFHRIALGYLRRNNEKAGLNSKVGVADMTDSIAILKRIIKENKYDLDPNDTAGKISRQKSKGIELEEYIQSLKKPTEQREFVETWREYQQALITSNLLDFDDILLRCVSLLRAHPDCVAGIDTVLVDEFQDTNGIQYQLMALFAQHANRITIVGDPDQCIYSWRSAEVKNLGMMREKWSSTITINLEENYRSTGAILHVAQQLIEQDEARPPKKLQATHEIGHRPVLRRLPTARDEAEWIATEIKRTQALTADLLEHSDFAILVRSAALSRSVEGALKKHHIPYRMVGGVKFYDRFEIKLILDYLRVINHTSHSEALGRIMNVPPRRIGEKTMDSLRDRAQKENRSLWSLLNKFTIHDSIGGLKVSSAAQNGLKQLVSLIRSCQKQLNSGNATIPELIEFVVKGIDLKTYLKAKYSDTCEGRLGNVDELLAQAAEVSSSFPVAIDEESVLTQESSDVVESPLTAFLADAALASATDVRNAEENVSASLVTISTIHAAKGLEWPAVFVPACYDGSIPHSRSENTDEERRLLYVAMTRAKGLLSLSCPIQDSHQQQTTLSSFISGSDVMECFADRGPNLRFSDVQALSRVIHRECPQERDVWSSSKTLERDQDDYWPTDGSVPEKLGEESGVSSEEYTSGFASVRTQMNSIMQSKHNLKEDRALKRQKVEQTKQQAVSDARAYQQQVSGQRDLVSFFQKPKAEKTSIASINTVQITTSTTMDALQGVSNQHASMTRVSNPSYTVRSQALLKKRRAEPPEAPYSFLSSSPTRPEDDQENKEVVDNKQGAMKAATTLHKTSMDVNKRTGKVLGMRRSLNGWPPGGKKN